MGLFEDTVDAIKKESLRRIDEHLQRGDDTQEMPGIWEVTYEYVEAMSREEVEKYLDELGDYIDVSRLMRGQLEFDMSGFLPESERVGRQQAVLAFERQLLHDSLIDRILQSDTPIG